jgi:hypothetical protein
MKTTRNFIVLALLSTSVLFTSCSREGCTDPLALNYDEKASKDNGSCEFKKGYEVPETYNFINVSYKGQTERLDMLDQLVVELKKGNNSGTVLSAQKLKEMYSNTGGHFSFTSSRQLKDKTFSSERAIIEEWMDKIAVASASTTPGSEGVAGVIVSTKDNTKKYLFDESGVEYAQWIEKGLMGSLVYYQAVSVYLSEEKIGNAVDNTNVVDGEGTKMEHHWDEAFGYFGVPKDFPVNKKGIRYHGKYCDARDVLMGSNKKMMDAFIKGRAAISNKDMETKAQMAKVVSEEWEKVIAATAISYLNKAKTDFADDALRNHVLSEATAFIWALKFNANRKITNAQVDNIINTIGLNFYNVTLQSIDSARNTLSTIYGLDTIKNNL